MVSKLPKLNELKIHTIKPKNALNVEIIFLHTICQNCDMFQSIVIVFRELLNISKAEIKTWVIKCVKICS